MKRGRDQEDDQEEEKKKRLKSIVATINRDLLQLQKERKELQEVEELEKQREIESNNNQQSYQHALKSSSLYAPKYLRSLSTGSRAEPEAKGEEMKEEENNQVTSSFYNQFFLQDLNKPLFEREKILPPPIERKTYQEALTTLPNELLHLIYELNVPEEVGTRREKCYTEVKRSEEGEGKMGETSFCKRNVAMMKEKSYNKDGEFIPILFRMAECGLYCLLTNLPTRVQLYVPTPGYADAIWHEFTVPFTLQITIDEINKEKDDDEDDEDESKDSGDLLTLDIWYDESKKTHIYKFNLISNGDVIRTRFLSANEAIDLIFYYGSSKTAFISFSSRSNFPDGTKLTKFLYDNKDSNSNSEDYWDIYLNNWNDEFFLEVESW
jgi:hypothetical protein